MAPADQSTKALVDWGLNQLAGEPGQLTALRSYCSVLYLACVISDTNTARLHVRGRGQILTPRSVVKNGQDPVWAPQENMHVKLNTISPLQQVLTDDLRSIVLPW